MTEVPIPDMNLDPIPQDLTSEQQKIYRDIPFRKEAETLTGGSFFIGEPVTTYLSYVEDHVHSSKNIYRSVSLRLESPNRELIDSTKNLFSKSTPVETQPPKLPIYLNVPGEKPLFYTWHHKTGYGQASRLLHAHYASATQRPRIVSETWAPVVQRYMNEAAVAHGIESIIQSLPPHVSYPEGLISEGVELLMEHFEHTCQTTEINPLVNHLFTFERSATGTIKENMKFVPHVYKVFFKIFDQQLRSELGMTHITPDILDGVDWRSVMSTMRAIGVGVNGSLNAEATKLVDTDIEVRKNKNGLFAPALTNSKKEKTQEEIERMKRVASGFQNRMESLAQYQQELWIGPGSNKSSLEFSRQMMCPVLPTWAMDENLPHPFDILTTYAIALYTHAYDPDFISRHPELFEFNAN